MTTNNYNTIYQIKGILRDREVIEKFYENNIQEFSNYLVSILNDKRLDLDARAEIAGEELYKIINRKEDDTNNVIIKDKELLQNILLECLKDKMLELKTFAAPINGLYMKNLEDIEPGTRRIIITDDANKAMREFIKSHPEEYLRKFFLRQHPEPSFKGVYYQLDPFLLYYFNEDWKSVEDFLDSAPVKNNFNTSQEEKNFYSLLKEAVEIAQKTKNEKFLVEDKKWMELANKFILIIHRTKL